MKHPYIREEELKNRIAQDYFGAYDCTKIIGNVDFCVCMPQSEQEEREQESLLWAEAKRGSANMYHSLVQLILTIGKARTFDRFLPPPFLGAFDGEKTAFVPYDEIQDIFYLNDFNWNIAPSNHDTKEFKLVLRKVSALLNDKTLVFDYQKDDKELRRFIQNNFVSGKFGLTKTRIDKNNFLVIYTKWLQTVKPTIGLKWEVLKKSKGIIDGDFYLADLLSSDNLSLKDKLFVYLKKDHYELERSLDELGMFQLKKAFFNDRQAAHTQFWNKYERPPKEQYWDYIVERRDLLVPQDIRERKGSFFTPQKWVELSQQYLAEVLGEDWQEEYYVWDCAAGTGNLLHGLRNKYNIWASTLDKQDVSVMHDRIHNGANLLDSHVFQFDFLNDDFSRLPEGLQEIIHDPKKRKRLVIYINPPYAEVSTVIGRGKSGVNKSRIHDEYAAVLGTANRELFAQFLARIYYEVPDSFIAEFSKLKALQGSSFKKFRQFFEACLEKMFIAPAHSFDNVRGKFPIGFKIWNTQKKERFIDVVADVFGEHGNYIGKKYFGSDINYISQWISSCQTQNGEPIGFLAGTNGNDFQHNNIVYILNHRNQMSNPRGIWINIHNLIEASIYFSVRHCIQATWLNDRDQFLAPNDQWEEDTAFQNDCLAFTLFHGQNRISSQDGANYWIPFTEQEVDARDKFESHFMTKFMSGKMKPNGNGHLLGNQMHRSTPLVFSSEAEAVFHAGRELWQYYHRQPECSVNASLYDIRIHFQGQNEKGKMNNKSEDETYTKLIGNLKDKLSLLARSIEPKVYAYGFLKR